jgi:hypothetical protein
MQCRRREASSRGTARPKDKRGRAGITEAGNIIKPIYEGKRLTVGAGGAPRSICHDWDSIATRKRAYFSSSYMHMLNGMESGSLHLFSVPPQSSCYQEQEQPFQTQPACIPLFSDRSCAFSNGMDAQMSSLFDLLRAEILEPAQGIIV